jgi:hypothetical protein
VARTVVSATVVGAHTYIPPFHAENDDVLNDGRKGVSRNTDIWRKQEDGGLRCIATYNSGYQAPE